MILGDAYFLCHVKVANHNRSVGIDEEIVELEIAVQDPSLEITKSFMQRCDCCDYTGKPLSGCLLRPMVVLEDVQKRPTRHVRHDEEGCVVFAVHLEQG